jgi:hypothetical protein
MTAMIGSADCPPARLAATREGLHRVAEHLLAAQALSRFAAEVPGDQPSPAVLWPEHFDVGITAGAINYGASPGDDHAADPYPYVSPHDGPPPGDPPFWNAPFGAARTFRQIGTVAEAAAFFRDGRARVPAAATPIRRTS